MTTTREAVEELATYLDHTPTSYLTPSVMAEELRKLLANTEEPQSAIAGEMHVHDFGPDPDVQIRLSALQHAGELSGVGEQADVTIERARTFYAFLAAEDTKEPTADGLALSQAEVEYVRRLMWTKQPAQWDEDEAALAERLERSLNSGLEAAEPKDAEARA